MVDDSTIDLEDRLPDSVFDSMMKAVHDEEPLRAMREVLYECRGKPYYDEALGTAKTMLLIERYYSRNRKNQN